MPTKGRTWKVKNRRQYDSRPKTEAMKGERRKQVLALSQAHKTIAAISEELRLDRGTVSNDLRFLSEQGEVNMSDIRANVSLSRREKWIKAIQDILDDAIPYFTSQGIKPSLRTAYYRLRARGLVNNTEGDYKSLIRHTREARLQETDSSGQLLYPILPIDCLADETRRLIDKYSDYEPREVQDPDEYMDDTIQALKDAVIDYDGKGTKGGRWYGQPEYVEVWIEKFADAPTFEKWLEEQDVNIVVNKGYTSISFLWENIKRLKEKVKEFKGSKHIHVKYFGDFDPSGEDMVNSLRKYFRRFGLSPNIIQKVALTQQQIEEYDIPLEPVKESDNRYSTFEAEYGDSGAEIDAFIATDPEGLKKILQDSVDQHFDQKIYDDMEKKYKTSTPLEELKEVHKGMLDRLETYDWKDEIKDELDEIYEERKDEGEEEESDSDHEDDDSEE